MHELAVTNRILRTVLSHARRNRAHRVHRVLLVVSEIADLQPLWLQHYFDKLAAGTRAEGARLEVQRVAQEFVCEDCSRRFAMLMSEVDRIACPACGSRRCGMVGTADYTVEEIEVS